jgi:hypothetical protein
MGGRKGPHQTADNDKQREVSNMFRRLRVIIMLIIFSVFMMYNAADAGEEVSRERIMGLDEQVQQIKSDVLSIAAELSTLEEKLLFPSNTQVAVFVSLIGGETFRLDALEIELGGEPVAHHLYTFKEFEALQKGRCAARLYWKHAHGVTRYAGLLHRQIPQWRRYTENRAI